jgi:MATE family multidrug resistance protein
MSMSLSNADPAWVPVAKPHRVIDEARSLCRLALPIMLIALVNMGMSITDTLMVSALFGAEALAAVAIGSDLYSILFYLGAGVLGGLAPFYTAAVVRVDALERERLERIGMAAVVLSGGDWFEPRGRCK